MKPAACERGKKITLSWLQRTLSFGGARSRSQLCSEEIYFIQDNRCVTQPGSQIFGLVPKYGNGSRGSSTTKDFKDRCYASHVVEILGHQLPIESPLVVSRASDQVELGTDTN
jgi:hypothetical protein